MYSNLPRDWTHFHRLGVCKCECFCLAGILITEGDLRQELLETLAASLIEQVAEAEGIFDAGEANFDSVLALVAKEVKAYV